jgi:carbonic anhydrase
MADGRWAMDDTGREMSELDELFSNNRAWAEKMTREDPEFFSRLTHQQSPAYLWVGCADSRVPANEIVGLLPGELFVHRNVANVVVHTDLNSISVIQFAVDVLRVRHIIVCGHYGCGGVLAALRDDRLGLVDNWLRHVQDVRDKHRDELKALNSIDDRHDRLCELNVIEQVLNVSQTTVVRDAWARGQSVSVNGLIYGLEDGLLQDLGIHINGVDDIPDAWKNSRAFRSGEHDATSSWPDSTAVVDPY